MREKVTGVIGPFFRFRRQTNPLRLLDYRRFDIPAKTIYGRAILDNNTSAWPRELYREHLEVWNGFKEREPKKLTFDDFDASFRSLAVSMSSGAFVSSRSPVGVTSTGQLFDGAHRVALAILLRKKLKTYHAKHAIKHYDYLFFKNRKVDKSAGLSQEYLDSLAIEYCNLQPRHMYIAVFFPGADEKEHESELLINEIGSIVYKKKIKISKKGQLNLIHQMYMGEHWNRYDNEKSVKHKAEQCFTGGDTIRVYLFESKKPTKQIQALKSRVRALYQIEKHSVHMSDTNLEARRLSRMFFNENSIHLINNAKDWRLPQNLKTLFDEYSALFEENENRCVDSSAVLALYGLRDCRDLDYIHRNAPLKDAIKLIGDHNPHAHYYNESIDEIITNPNNHLYYNGYKFASLGVVRNMKFNRAEEKDNIDIALIDGLA